MGIKPRRINDAQADLRLRQPRPDARKRRTDIARGPAPAVGYRMAKQTVCIPAGDDTVSACRITGNPRERFRNPVLVDLIADERLCARRSGRRQREQPEQQPGVSQNPRPGECRDS